MAESIFKDRFPGYFELVDAIVDAIEVGGFVRGRPEGLPDGDDEAFIVHRAALPNEDPKIHNVDGLLATAFAAQLNKFELETQVPKAYAFGSTRYDGNGCFFFRWPDDREIDIAALRESVQFYKDMISEATPEISMLQEPYFDNQVAVGPVSLERCREFDVLLHKIISYSSTLEDVDPVRVKDVPLKKGMVFLFDQEEYTKMFRHEKDFKPFQNGLKSGANFLGWDPSDGKMN